MHEGTPEIKLSRQMRRTLERKEKKNKARIPKVDVAHDAISHALVIIDADIVQRGIRRSAQELFIWPQFPDYVPQDTPVQEPNLESSYQRVNTVLYSMEQSKNPYFSDTIKYLKNSVDLKSILLNPVHYLPEKRHALMAVRPDITEDKTLQWRLNISLESAAKKPNGIGIALAFVHETEHIKRWEDFFTSLDPKLSLEEQLDLHYDYFGDPEHVLIEEAYAEAATSEAQIYQIGLGYEEKVDREILLQAGKYLECGRNPESAQWKNYLRSLEWKEL
jgi:hypothetical protein